jgi:hypothetical protein
MEYLRRTEVPKGIKSAEIASKYIKPLLPEPKSWDWWTTQDRIGIFRVTPLYYRLVITKVSNGHTSSYFCDVTKVECVAIIMSMTHNIHCDTDHIQWKECMEYVDPSCYCTSPHVVCVFTVCSCMVHRERMALEHWLAVSFGRPNGYESYKIWNTKTDKKTLPTMIHDSFVGYVDNLKPNLWEIVRNNRHCSQEGFMDDLNPLIDPIM